MLESEIGLSISKITDTVNKSCEALGAKGGEFGIMQGLWESQGDNLRRESDFTIEGAGPGAAKEYILTSTAPIKIEFFRGMNSTGRWLTCKKLRAEGRTEEPSRTTLRFGRPGWEECETNVLKTTQPATVTASIECRFFIMILSNISPYRAYSGWEPAFDCIVDATVGPECVIRFSGIFLSRTSLTNTGKTVNKVEVKEGNNPLNLSTIAYTSNKCGTNIPAQELNAQYRGESILEGVTSEVKVI